MAVKKKETQEKSYPLIEIELKKGLVGRTQKQRAIVKGLGLRKVNSKVTREKRPEILGMIKKVEFMLQVTDVETRGA
jgi:large subunit ribosomal protein L30